MLPLGFLIRAGKGVNRGIELRQLIDEIEVLIETPILDAYSGVARFEAANLIQDAKISDFLETNPDKDRYRVFVERYIQELIKEFEMAASELEKQYANKAQIAALGIAIKEIALTLDDEIEEFRKKSTREIERFTKELERNMNDKVHSAVERQMTTQREEILRIASENCEKALNKHRAEIISFIRKTVIGSLIFIVIVQLGVSFLL
ncbi:MAG: hypothetical protein R3C61_02165 [Bacteroidia bacterium]